MKRLDGYNSVKSDENQKVKNCEVDLDAESPNLKGDYQNVGLLLLFYLMQGVPQGIGLAVPILLQNRGVSYADQAKFSFSFFPYSLKLLWAPIVDSIYLPTFGRRKSWICSSQLIIGIFMIFLSFNIDAWLLGDSEKPQIFILTVVFGFLWFLTSAQDIAVDGWGLTLLQRRNVGYVATCNSVGQSTGKFIGFTLLLVFESREFCNEFLFSEPQATGLFTLSSFMLFWGILYLSFTLVVAVFKREKCENLENQVDYGISRAYPILLDILKLKPVLQLVAMICSIEVTFAVWEGVTSLKLVEYGISKDKIALMMLPTAPIQILTPLFLTRFTTGPKPLTFYYKVFPCRLVAMISTAAVVYSLDTFTSGGGEISKLFYGAIILAFMIEQGLIRAAYTAEGAFDAKIADPLIGGTYITLINTSSHLGKRISTTFFLWLLDKITWRTCEYENENATQNFATNFTQSCNTKEDNEFCAENAGHYSIFIDGFYIEIAISVIYGLIWMKIFKKIIEKLQTHPREDWYVLSKENCEDKEELSKV